MISYLVWPDYLIFAGFLAISLGIGVYHSLTGGKQKTTAEFILADRQLKVLPTTISLLVTFISAVSLLGFPAEMYCYGTQMFVYISFMCLFLLIITERIFVPWLYPLQLVSVYEYLERRYKSKSVRILGASLGVSGQILYMGACMYAPSAALESATGLPITVSIPLISCVAVTYTALGGMRAVIWTDVFQFIIMSGGLVAIIIKGLIVVGGFSNVIRLAGEEGRIELANFSPDPRERHTVWGLLIGLTITWANSFGLPQASIQRYTAVDRLYKARIAVLLNIPSMILLYAVTCSLGLIALAYFSIIKCDPLANGDISNSNQILPFFVVRIFSDSPGFGGLFLSSLYGGALSSISSSLSGSAANIWEDVLDWKFNKIPESKKALINRFLVVLLGALATGIAFLASSIAGPMTQVVTSLYGSAYGPLMGIFIIGGLTKLVNWKGALFGAIFGAMCILWIAIGSQTSTRRDFTLPPLSTEGCQARNFTLNSSLYYDNQEVTSANHHNHLNGSGHLRSPNVEYHGLENFYAISYVWYVPLGALLSSVTALFISLLTKDKEQEKVDDVLLIKFKEVLNCSLRDEVGNEHTHDEDLTTKADLKMMNALEDEFFDEVSHNRSTKRNTNI